MNTVYQVGDTVYDARFGWGAVIKIVKNIDEFLTEYPTTVLFNNDEYQEYTLDGKYLKEDLTPSLSFTEYDFVKGGFSQERPEVLPERGTVVWVRDEDEDKWLIAHFMCKKENGYKANALDPFDDNTGSYWKQMTTKNPYTNEN